MSSLSQTQNPTQSKPYPPPASLEYVEGKLVAVYGFRVEGAPLAPVVSWYEHNRVRYGEKNLGYNETITHVVYPHLNIHVMLKRFAGVGDDKWEEYVYIEPWAKAVSEDE